MPESIRDGQGTGYLASVNDGHRLLTSTVAVPLQTHVSDKYGESYSLGTNALTLNSADTWAWVLYWENTSTTKDLFIANIEYSWNGGSTNYDKPLRTRNLIASAGAPTSNHTLVTASNNNKTSNNAADLLVYKWDGVADGMENDAGGAGGDVFIDRGYTKRDFNGAVISGLGEKIGIQVQAPEVGIFTVVVNAYFVEKGRNI